MQTPETVSACTVCTGANARHVCSMCHTRYCSAQCQEKDWIDNGHFLVCSEWPEYVEPAFDDSPAAYIGSAIETELDPLISSYGLIQEIGATMVPNQPPAIDNTFKQRGFYKSSLAKMKSLPSTDFFAWMCIQSYKTSPNINAILFKVNGDFTKFDEQFNGIAGEKARTAEALRGSRDPYSIFGTFFATPLTEAVGLGRPLLDPRTRQPITTEQALLSAYPAMRGPLTMRSKAAFTRLYVRTIEKLIFSIPRSPKGQGNAIRGFRGYTPLGLMNTLTLRPSQMRVGQEITNWGLMSISLDYRVSTLFVGKKTNPGCCFLDITVPSNFPAFLVSSDSGDRDFPEDLTPWKQMEILMPVGCVFKVTQTTGENPVPLSTNDPGGVVYTPIAYLTLVRIAKKRTK